MNEFEIYLFNKGYCKLVQGSYRTWISKRWHEMFVRRGLVTKNFDQQYSPYKDTLPEFLKWLAFYDKSQHDREFPRSKRFLTEEELIEIRTHVF